MKQDSGTETEVNALACAQHLMDVTPHIMQTLRKEMRRHRPSDYSVPEFRTLNYIERHEGTSLTEIAEYIGLSKPSLSKIVTRLEEKGFVKRRAAADDKRRHTLSLSAHGQRTLDQIERDALHSLAGRLARLQPSELDAVVNAMELLRPAFVERTE